MSSHREQNHAQSLRDLLAGSHDPWQEFATSQFASCEECRAEIQSLHSVADHLDDAAADAHRQEQDSNSYREPGLEQQLTDFLRAQVKSRARRSKMPRRVLGGAALTAIAATLLLFILFPRSSPSPDGSEFNPNVRLGNPRLLSPEGEVSTFEEFSWDRQVPQGGWFVVRVHDASAPDDVALTTTDRLGEPRWRPRPEEREAWPDQIFWVVEVYDGSSPNPVGVQGAHAERHPR